MPEYSVTWTIDGIDADNPEEAARQAKALRESADSTADVYEVRLQRRNARTRVIDLSALDGRSV